MYAVLISVYNSTSISFFQQAYDSIIAQTLKPSSIHIVRDGTVNEKLESYIDTLVSSNVHVHKYENNQGLGFALNYGMRFISEDFILRMDSDDISHPERAAILYNEIVSTGKSVVGSNIVEFSSNIENVHSIIRYKQTVPPYSLKNYKRDPVGHASVIFKKADVIKSGGYFSSLYFEDTYLWLRMSINGYSFNSINKNLYFARTDSDFLLRRSGINYAVKEAINFLYFWSEGLISNKSLLLNLITRPFLRLLPLYFLKQIYLHFLRK